MRDILFKGQCLDNKEWVEGYYCRQIVNIGGKIVLKPVIQVINNFCEIKTFEVDPETVGHFTGLTKSDQKVFEGDIGWDSHHECYGVVEFQDSAFVYVYENIIDDLCNALSGPDIEIIGNRWDNPELLEGGR